MVFGAGAFDFHRDCRVAQLSFEYRIGLPKFRIAQAIMGALVPFNGSLYLYGGFGLDIFLGKHLVITPSFCPGVYFQGKGKNLGYPLEFRSSVEVAYVFTNRSRIGVQGYHILEWKYGGKKSWRRGSFTFLRPPSLK